jgi:hypothetical protein
MLASANVVATVALSPIDEPSGVLSHLLRIVVGVDRDPFAIVTAYRTSNLEKYRSGAMKAIYDAKTDTLTLEFRPGPVAESDEDKPGVILDSAA